MNKYILLLALFFSLHQIGADTFSVMTMNVENLFDTKDDYGKDDKAFLPLSKKSSQNHINSCQRIRVNKWKNECLFLDWNDEAKNAKLQNIVKTITLYDDVGPDIIFFQEVENKNILKQLFLLLSTYGYVDFDSIEGNDYRGIDNAYLSKYKIQKTKQHKIIFSPEFSTKDTRPILEAVIDFNGKPIHFYNVHFPAPYNPIGMRKDAFNTLKKVTSSHSNAVIALGDFNVTSFEADNNKTFTSLDKDWDISHIAGCSNCSGSHYYRRDDNWSFLDVIIIKENRGISFKNESINVLKTNISTNKEGKPLSFNMNNGEGVSDHLPVIATISIN